jgi:hypothetical protein
MSGPEESCGGLDFRGHLDSMKPPRTAWGKFPDVQIHASETAVKKHPSYHAAKLGDADAAAKLVSETINNDQMN